MGLSNSPVILSVEGLVVDFPDRSAESRVLHDICLSLRRGETLGLVGESGSGKSVLARALVRLESPATIVSGSVLLDGQELTTKSRKEMRQIRGKKISMVLQDPRSAMDPVFTMGTQFREVLLSRDGSRIGSRGEKKDILHHIYELLESVGIASPNGRCRQYPHEWSRGMLQRAQVVMAFSTSPEVLILDEVTSALDPTICLQLLDTIIRLKDKQDTGIILITHDLSVAMEVCDRVAVMKRGRIVETGTVREIFDRPVHPYTHLLVSAIREHAGS
jgi:peptide/nickel transport system ATP-binding protein